MSKTLVAGVPAAFVALALLAAPAAITMSPQPAVAQNQEFSDQELQAFAVALNDISDISVSAQEEINQAENPEQIQQIRNEANEEMVQAIRSAGLGVETYNTIYRQMRGDEELAERVEEMRESQQ